MTPEILTEWDRTDLLAPFRDRFVLPPGVIYLDGNSLGPLPKATPGRVAQVVEQEWGQSLIRSWNQHGWINLATRVAAKIGTLIGGEDGGTMVADSTSINLFKLLSAALRLRPDRKTILTETGNFPADLYIAEGLAGLLDAGHQVVAVDNPAAALGPDVAVLMLTHVNYRTGTMHRMQRMTQAAHEAGALVLWDLSHSTGVVPLSLAGDDVDFAVGCGYKYLNGGPGAPAFLYAAPRLHDAMQLPLTGWLGHRDPFAFSAQWSPAEGMARAVVGTPPILSLAALECGVDLALEAPIHLVREKTAYLTGTFLALTTDLGFGPVGTPDPDARGSQVSFTHRHGYAIIQALIERGVIGDFRAPNVLRFGFGPLFLRYIDMWDAAMILREIMTTGIWREDRFQQGQTVT